MMMKNSVQALLLISLLACGLQMNAQDWKTDHRANLVFGLTQPLLVSGFNIEGNYIYRRFIFDYSHGASLDFSGNTSTQELRGQSLAVHVPYTTGFGVGYRFAEWLNLRLEPKWHRFEFYYEGDARSRDAEITSFNTFSLGLGLYGAYQPFKRQDNFLSGFLIAPSIRFWPTFSSTLEGDEFAYFNRVTLAEEAIKTLDPGIGFTPFVFNISIGYTFDLKKRR